MKNILFNIISNITSVFSKTVLIGQASVSLGAIATTAVISTAVIGGTVFTVSEKFNASSNTDIIQEATNLNENDVPSPGETPAENTSSPNNEFYNEEGNVVDIVAEDVHYHNIQTEIIKESTCIEQGIAIDTCLEDDYSYTYFLPLKAHTESEWVIEKEATATSEGLRAMYCSVCGTLIKSEVIPIVAHEHNYVLTDSKTASCTENGYNHYTCSICNSAYEEITTAKGHTYDIKYVEEPTCEKEGHTYSKCSVCGDIIETGTIEKKNHEYSDWKTVEGKEVTCTLNGEESHNCSLCGKVETRVILATGHTKDESLAVITKAATCTEDGVKTYTCTKCGETFTEVIPATGHNMVLDSKIDSNCSDEGVEHYICSVCGQIEDRAISAKGHISSDWIIDTNATCLTDGSKHKECTVCNAILNTEVIPATGHNMVLKETIVPTCTTVGYDVYQCSVCGETEQRNEVASYNCNDYASDWIVDIAATCSLEGTQHKECTKCGKVLETNLIAKVPHSYSSYEVITPATEDTTGLSRATCTVCGAIDEKIIAKLPHVHDYNTEIERVEPTCTTDGYYILKCKCESTLKVDLPKTGHTYQLTLHTDADCLTDGGDTYTCSKCNDTYTDVIPATGHTSGEWETTKEATDLEDGEKVRKCINCGSILETQTISKLPHTCDFITLLETQAPTCTTDGFEKYQCKCGLVDTFVLPKTNHANSEWKITQAATYTEMGLRQNVCNDCGYVLETENIPVIPHECTYEITSQTAPTCTTAGTTVNTCSICGKTQTITVPATGHTEGGWITDTSATCEADGSQHTECAVCHTAIKTAIIPAIGHNMGGWATTTPATCEANGIETRTCSNCSHQENRSIPALQHVYGDWIIDVEATEGNPGSKHKECSRCGNVITEDIAQIVPHVHAYNETASTPATCTTTGSRTFTCDCGDSYVETISKLPHTPSDWIIDSNATCTTDGSKHTECTACHVTITTEAISATGHNYGTAVIVAPTCTVDGKSTITCTTCGNVEETNIPATGHNYVEKEKTAATCTTEGSVTYECSNCGDTYTDTITQLTHDYEMTSTTAPTCTADGYSIETCKNCGETNTINIVPKLGHDEGTWVITKEAALGIEGERELRCTRCGYVIQKEAIPMLMTDGTDSVYYIEIDAQGTQKMVIGHFETAMSEEMFNKVNAYRIENGIVALTKLSVTGQNWTTKRALETSYIWDHARPNGYALDYPENIATSGWDSTTVDEVFNAWKNSAGHNANMLDDFYSRSDVKLFYLKYESSPGIFHYTQFWVQSFY